MSTSDSIVIVWRTDELLVPVVKFGRTHEELDSEESDAYELKIPPHVDAIPKEAQYGRLHSAAPCALQYEMTLCGLEIDSKYYYAVFNGDKLIAGGDSSHTFRTHPVEGDEKPMPIWVVGDSGNGEAVVTAH